LLRVDYDSGPVFTLGAIDVQGLDRFDRSLIDRHNKLKPGERYSQERLQGRYRIYSGDQTSGDVRDVGEA